VELIGLYLVGCALLVAAGVAKLVRPDDTARAFSAVIPIGLVRSRLVVRVGSLAEAVLGMTAFVAPRSLTGWLVALSFAAFAVFVAIARAQGGAIASCGCFGTPDTPATLVHVVINAVLACAAAAVALSRPTGTLAGILAAQPAHGIPLLAASALCAWLTYVAISLLAQLDAARRLTAVSFDRHRADR
jgi:hypothetical protein